MIELLRDSRDRQLGILVSCLAMLSLAAFIGEVYGIVDMSFTMAFIALPGTILIIGIARWSVGADHLLFYRRLLMGLWFGAAATAVYDITRLVAQNMLPVDFNAFAIHPKFGALLIHQPETTLAAKVTGWGYHFSNGLTFALCYALVAGRAPWWTGVIYALCLQTAMTVTYPSAFGLSPTNVDFLTVAFIGHAAYGATLGVLNRRYNIDEDDWDAGRRPRSFP